MRIKRGDSVVVVTGDQKSPTPHRVINRNDASRYAIPFFLGPHVDTVIACLPTCQSAGNPARFPPIAYGDYLVLRLLGYTTAVLREVSAMWSRVISSAPRVLALARAPLMRWRVLGTDGGRVGAVSPAVVVGQHEGVHDVGEILVLNVLHITLPGREVADDMLALRALGIKAA